MRWRLQVWYGLLIGALLLAFAVTAYEFEKTARIDRIDDELGRLVFALNSANRGPPAPRGTKSGSRPAPPPPVGAAQTESDPSQASARRRDRL